MYEVKEDELKNRQLPKHLSLEQTAGIVTIEIFDQEYLSMLSDINIPLLAVDAFAGADITIMDYDFISMENIASTIKLTSHIISKGAKKLGFIGDIKHCNSFYERFLGFSRALENNDIKLANDVIQRDNIIDALYENCLSILIKSLGENVFSPKCSIYTTLIVKYIERIADHAVNIAEWVIYIDSGYYKDKQIF
jgi:DNA-binding LacI/PurR family transcriptional regulator